MNDDPKARALAQYHAIGEALDKCLAGLRQLRFSNHEFVNEREDLASAVEQTKAELKAEVETYSRNVQSDRLVIAFFGETNAGKSTIIEAFRILNSDHRPEQDDGLIVGEGRPDFTTKAQEYNLSIHGHPFVLIDVPGIEGDEAKFRDIIKEALSKAYIVFYVHALDKKPDEGTAGKIKNYLAEWSRVYTIQNVKGSAMMYRDEENRKTLLTEGVLKTERAIKVKFNELLGSVYEGNVPVQALLAMSARASFAPQKEKLVNDQGKLLKLFGSPEEMLRFSQFQTLQNLVEDKAQHFPEEIAKSNKRKLEGFAKRVESAIDQMVSAHKEEAGRKKKLLCEFRNEANVALSSLGFQVDDHVKSALGVCYNTLGRRANEILSTKEKSNGEKAKKAWKQAQVRQLVNDFPAHAEQELNATVKREADAVFAQLREPLQRRINSSLQPGAKASTSQARKLEGIDFFENLAFELNLQFEIDKDILEDGLEELNVNWEDAAQFAVSAGGGALLGASIGSAGGPAGVLIGAGIGAVLAKAKYHLWGRKAKVASAQDSMASMIKKSRQASEKALKSQLGNLKRQIDEQKENLLRQVDKEINEFAKMQDIMDALDEDIQEIVN